MEAHLKDLIMKNQRVVDKEHPGLTALRNILKRKRWDEQGGYSGYKGEGKWDFISTGLPQVSPQELNELFALVGLEPDVIIPLGDCEDCAHSKNGREQGYHGPCSPCKRPRMSNFTPIKLRVKRVAT